MGYRLLASFWFAEFVSMVNLGRRALGLVGCGVAGGGRVGRDLQGRAG